MKWNVYIARRVAGGDYESDKHVVEVPSSSRGDNAYVTSLAAKHFRAPMGKVLCIPTPKSELRHRAVAVLGRAHNDQKRRGKKRSRWTAAAIARVTRAWGRRKGAKRRRRR
jgi:hypothetical protein